MYYGSPFGTPQQSPLQALRETIDFWKSIDKEMAEKHKPKDASPKKKDKWLEVAQTFVTMAAFAPIVGFGQLIMYLELAHWVKGMTL